MPIFGGFCEKFSSLCLKQKNILSFLVVSKMLQYDATFEKSFDIKTNIIAFRVWRSIPNYFTLKYPCEKNSHCKKKKKKKYGLVNKKGKPWDFP